MINKLRGLPPLPSGIARLLSLDQADSAYFDDATTIIRADPALSAQVVKMANSALYAGEGDVDRLDQALLRVGTREVVGALTMAFLRRVFQPRRPGLEHVWLTNLLSAIACREIAIRTPDLGLVPETAYTHALLHHVGRLVIVDHFAEAMAELAAEWPDSLLVLPEREIEVFGFSHEMAGRLLANRWRFPSGVTQVIGAHHLPHEERQGIPTPVARMIDLVNLGDCLADTLRGVDEIDDERTARVERELDGAFLAEVTGRLGVTREAILDGLENIVAGMAEQRVALGS